MKASDNTGVVKVTSNGTIFKNSGGQWLGSINAASVIGKASVTINVTDAAGNTAQSSVDYNVVNRVGGISITSMPKPLTLYQCSSGILNVKLISTANIDDLVNVIINTNGISSASAINLTWFNRTLVPVQVPSGRTVIVPLRVTIPGDAVIGYRMFKDNAKSLGFNATSVDTGVVNVRK